MDELDLVEMRLKEILSCEGAGAQIIVLGEANGERSFPIFIGYHEMDALDRALHGKQTARPLTHDLVLNVIEGMGGELERVVVDDLKNDTFFGKLGVKMPTGERELIDSRPSDAMVLAVRRGVPIFVAERVLETINANLPPDDDEEAEGE